MGLGGELAEPAGLRTAGAIDQGRGARLPAPDQGDVAGGTCTPSPAAARPRDDPDRAPKIADVHVRTFCCAIRTLRRRRDYLRMSRLPARCGSAAAGPGRWCDATLLFQKRALLVGRVSGGVGRQRRAASTIVDIAAYL